MRFGHASCIIKGLGLALYRCCVKCCVSVVWCYVVLMVCVVLSLLGEVGEVGGE